MATDTRQLELLADVAKRYDALPHLRSQGGARGVPWEQLVPGDHEIFAPLTKDYLLGGYDHLPPRLGPWVFPVEVVKALEEGRRKRGTTDRVRSRLYKQADKLIPRGKWDWIGLDHLPRLTSILTTLGIFAVLNVIFWFGQDLWHHSEGAEFDQLKPRLASLKSQIDTLEAQVKSQAASLSRLKDTADGCQTRLTSFEAQAINNRLPAAIYDQYESTRTECSEAIGTYNAGVVPYNALRLSYSAKISEYNSLLPRANELARVVGTHYYFVPVPSLSHGGAAAHH